MAHNIYFIIPAYNEEARIGEIVREIVLSTYKVVVIDDCSSDNTKLVALNAGAIVLTHQINLGQGAALQTGIDYVLLQNGDIFITFDADAQHQLSDAKKLLDVIKKNEADVAIGSRFLGIKALNMPSHKKIILRLATLFTRALTGVRVTDAHNGLRAFNRKFAQSFQIKQNRMAHATEIIINIKKFRYQEVPVEILYTSYSLNKGQRCVNSINIIIDLITAYFYK